jgi:protein involved in sex pheromone biosynthesis
MKRFIYGALVSLLLLGGCAPKFEKQDEVIQEEDKTKETAIIPNYNISNQYYRTILPFKPSQSRGVVVGNLNTRYDIAEFETGLMRIAQNVFSTEDYFFQEGQYLDRSTINAWLNRKYTEQELKAKKIDPEKNLGLNPPNDGKGTIAEQNEKNPIYLAHILEHNYLIKSDEDTVKLGGVVIGLALNSVHYYQEIQYGPTFTVDIPHEKVVEQGKKIADEVLKRLRQMDGLANIPIVIALYEQKGKNSVVPGNFFAYTYVSNNSSKIDKWEEVNEKYYLFPSSEAEKEKREDYTIFVNFKDDVEEYFPNYNGVVGRGFYVNDQLQDLKIEIPIQFYGKGETIGFTQYVTGLVMDHFPPYLNVEVNVTSVTGPEALIVRKPNENEPFVHIYD